MIPVIQAPHRSLEPPNFICASRLGFNAPLEWRRVCGYGTETDMRMLKER